MSERIFRGVISSDNLIDTTTNGTANTWDKIFDQNLNRVWLFIQNISTSDMEIGLENNGTIYRAYLLVGSQADSLKESYAHGIPTNAIYIRCPSTASEPFLAHQRI